MIKDKNKAVRRTQYVFRDSKWKIDDNASLKTQDSIEYHIAPVFIPSTNLDPRDNLFTLCFD